VFGPRVFDYILINMTSHILPEKIPGWLRRCSQLARRGICLRYVTPAWVDAFTGEADWETARQTYYGWSQPHSWWHAVFRSNSLQIVAQRQDESWDTWVLLAPVT
jgi:hypothetical protein